jgi:hypothetical protein
MRYFDVEQASPEWFKLRLGVPTASEFSNILTPTQGKLSKSADRYISQLIGEQLSLIPPEGIENYTSKAMRWGQQAEQEARAYYRMENNCETLNGGFCMDDTGRFGCSPDFLVGPVSDERLACYAIDRDARGNVYGDAEVDAAGELKCPQPQTQVDYLLANTLPDDYRWQVHGHLVVTGAPYCDFMSYSPGLPPLIVRVEPSADTELLRAALDQFWDRYQITLSRVKEMYP